MGILRLILISCAVMSVTYCNDGNDSDIDPMPLPNKHSTTKSPTTVHPITSTASPNITTVHPITSTASPNTTTGHPTTSTASPTTTTVRPTTTASPTTTTVHTTTSTAKPTAPPTAKPIPDPGNPQMGNWTVDYPKTNRSCIVVDIAVQFEVLEKGSNKTIKYNLPKNATASGGCEKDDQKLVLRWGNKNDSLTFDFIKTNTSKFLLQSVKSTLFVSLPETGPKSYSLIHNHSEFSTPLTKSYKCAIIQTLNLTEEKSNVTFAYLHVSHVQFQAFKNVSGHSFDSAMDCEGSITPDIVPIVVGCVLTALIVMVLIAYIIGRRRCQARGYLSMYSRLDREEGIPMINLPCFR